MKKVFIILFSLTVIGVLGVVFWLKPSLEVPPLETLTVRLAWLHQAQFAGMYVAEEKGFYRDARLTVNLEEFSFESDSISDLVEGKVDFAVVSAEEVFQAADAGLPIKAIAVIYQIYPYAFASLADSGIDGPEDFKSRILGNQGGNIQADVTYRALLNAANVPESDVTFVNLNFDEVNDLVRHRADVTDLYRTDQPYLFAKEGVEINLIYPERYGFKLYGDTIVTTDKMIEENPEVVKRFVDATVKGWRVALDNQKEAASIVLPYTSDHYKDLAYQEYILAQSEALIRPSAKFKIGSMQYLPWQQAYQTFLDAGIVKNKIDATKLYITDFVE